MTYRSYLYCMFTLSSSAICSSLIMQASQSSDPYPTSHAQPAPPAAELAASLPIPSAQSAPIPPRPGSFKVSRPAVASKKSVDSYIVTTQDEETKIFGIFRGTGLTEKQLKDFNDPLMNKVIQQTQVLTPQQVAQRVSNALPPEIIKKQLDLGNIRKLFSDVNRIILNPGENTKLIGSTSATIAHIENNLLYTYSVGDATIYLLEEGKQLELLATAQNSNTNIGSPTFSIENLQIQQTTLDINKNYILVLLAPDLPVNQQERVQKIIAQTPASVQHIANELIKLSNGSTQTDLTALVIKLQTKVLSLQLKSKAKAREKETAAKVQPQSIPSSSPDKSRITLLAQAIVRQTQSWGSYFQAKWSSLRTWLGSWRN